MIESRAMLAAFAVVAALLIALGAPRASASVAVRWSSEWSTGDPPVLVEAIPGNGAYVAHGRTSTMGSDLVLRRYDDAGNILWARFYSGSVPGFDTLADLAVDSNHNAILAGRSGTFGATYSIAVVKYRPDGTRAWEHVIPRPTACGWGQFDGLALAIDSGDNVLIASHIDCGFLIIKLDPNGNTVWLRSWATGQPGGDVATDVAVDGNDNVVVAGTINGGVGEYATVVYDPDGALLWDRREAGLIGTVLGPAYVTVGPSNLICVAGSPETPCGLPRLMTWVYELDGTLRWRRDFGAVCDGNASKAVGIATDTVGNVLVGATHAFMYRTVKYDPHGNLLWTASYAGTSDVVASEVGAVAVGSGDVALVTGRASAPGVKEVFTTVAYQPDGAPAWLEEYGKPASTSVGNDISCDGDLVYVSGARWDSQQGLVAVVVCYQNTSVTDASASLREGSLLWNRPNPFNPVTRIGFRVEQPTWVRLEIFDQAGRMIRRLVDEPRGPGSYEAIWDGREDSGRPLATGVYFLRFRAGSVAQTSKMLLLK